MPGPKRYRPPSCTVQELPPIDVVVISHNHYDHLDIDSVKALVGRFGTPLKWFVPAGLKDWMTSSGCEDVSQMTWWEEIKVKKETREYTIAFTPTQHWSKRTPTNDNKVI